jgi:hypothetical protein
MFQTIEMKLFGCDICPLSLSLNSLLIGSMYLIVKMLLFVSWHDEPSEFAVHAGILDALRHANHQDAFGLIQTKFCRPLELGFTTLPNRVIMGSMQ